MSQEKVTVRGLRDVAAADSKLSFVDPKGLLYYLGYNIDNLVENVIYAEVAYLLVHQRLPKKQELEDFRSQLFLEMNLPEPIIESIKNSPKNAHPMSILRTEVSHLAEFDPDGNEFSPDANLRRATRLIAKVPTIVATLYRSRLNRSTPEPKKEFDFAKNFLYMFKGEEPDDNETRVIHRFMILHADHGFNASTFAARVTASTNSDIYSAVTSAIGTLKGPLHGGASEKVMDMLDDINLEEEVEEYIDGLLEQNKKIMGFGHRMYKAQDPRTKHLRGIVEDFCHQDRTSDLYNKCISIENIVYERKKIYPNVDFYAAVAMDALGVPKDFFPLFFASSRISGWVAHILEQYDDAVLLRPASNYIGELGRVFVPINQR
ncbi:MAG: citrate/2-methylcitrate synthase [Candidatus Bathyarchaeia archaeon]|nr:citrate/2-methylcitrate synthase [Candidatus Bathyarchaeota archaeon]MDI9578520.1 citrate/2-methylcitrate synthase [Thermoproteota archaeon]MDT8782422.1 citrate synthase [Candidatus Bathyarchaeota archaeon]NLD66426.1 citrate synthase [Thermoproteota archaeon]